ncbi:MAG: hypothetical protein ACREUU_09760, partial [Gammaproteobacteria bacterium]
VEWLREPSLEPVPEEFESLKGVLGKLVGNAGFAPVDPMRHIDESEWLGFRLAELLPVDLNCRQALLETSCPKERLARIRQLLAAAGRQKVRPKHAGTA